MQNPIYSSQQQPQTSGFLPQSQNNLSPSKIVDSFDHALPPMSTEGIEQTMIMIRTNLETAIDSFVTISNLCDSASDRIRQSQYVFLYIN